MPVAVCQVSGGTLTLDQAIQLSLKQSSSVQACELDVKVWEDRLKSTRSHYLPKIHVTAVGAQPLAPVNFLFQKGALGSTPDTGPIPNKDTNVSAGMNPIFFLNTSVIQPMSDVFTVRLGMQKCRIGQEAARQKLRQEKQTVANKVKQQYYKALEFQDAHPLIETTEALCREVYRTSNEYLAVKAILQADMTEVKHQLAAAELQKIQIENGLDSAKDQLNMLMGRELSTPFTVASVGEAPSADVEAGNVRTVSLSRPEIKQQLNEISLIDLERKTKKLKFLPDVYGIVDYLSFFGAQDILPRNIVFAGFAANWEPIDWGKRRAEVNEQKKLLVKATILEKDLEKQVTVELNDAIRRMKEARALLQVNQFGREVALEKLRVLANKYKEKATLLKDVLQAQKNLAQANSDYSKAVLSMWSARADYEKALGVDVL